MNVEYLRAGQDADDVASRESVYVPMFSSPSVKLPVELGEPDSLGMRAAFLVDEEGGTLPIPLGYLAPGEGRWALRDLILAELIARFPTRPGCGDTPCDSQLRAPDSAVGVVDTWYLLVHGRCHKHWKEYLTVSPNDDDLIPVL